MLSRIYIALILIACLALAIYFGEIGIKVLILTIAALAIYEVVTIFFANKINNKHEVKALIKTSCIAALVIYSLTLESSQSFLILLASLAVITITFFDVILEKKYNRIILFIISYLYIYLAFYLSFKLFGLNHKILLNDKSYQIPKLALEVILIVIATDTFAYIFGKLIGGVKLMPKVSPNKTLSGLIFGLLFGLATSYLYRSFLNIDLEGFVFFALTIAISSVIGDLLQSAVKRYLQVKDTSKLLLGHGGILDRMDGMLLAIITASIYNLF